MKRSLAFFLATLVFTGIGAELIVESAAPEHGYLLLFALVSLAAAFGDLLAAIYLLPGWDK